MQANFPYYSTFNLDSSENVAYNQPLFPLYVRPGKLSSYPYYAAISHWHEDLEFLIVKKGRLTYNVNGNLIELTENTGIMVNSRQLHYGFSTAHNECEFICILFSTELFKSNSWFYENFITPITEHSTCPWLHLTPNGWQKTILRQLDRIYEIYAQTPDGNFKDSRTYFRLTRILYLIMELLEENLPAASIPSNKENTDLLQLKSMISYMEEHFSASITLDEIAASGTCCKSKASALFQKYLRDTPISYLTKLRLRKSLELLLRSDQNITETAGACGFSTPSYYCEIFRKYYGISPLKYRQSIRK